jgi:hypothetical protein
MTMFLRRAGLRVLVQPAQVDHERLEPAVVLVFREPGLLVSQGRDGQLQLVASAASFRGDVSLAIAQHQVELVGADAVERGTVLGAPGGADAAEPFGRRPQPVTVIVQEGMLRGQLRARSIVLFHLAACRQECLQHRYLPVLVQVGAGVRDRLGHEAAEPGVVCLAAAPGRGDHDAIRAR